MERKRREWFQVIYAKQGGDIDVTIFYRLDDVRRFADACKEQGQRVTAIIYMRMVEGVPVGQLIYQ